MTLWWSQVKTRDLKATLPQTRITSNFFVCGKVDARLSQHYIAVLTRFYYLVTSGNQRSSKIQPNPLFFFWVINSCHSFLEMPTKTIFFAVGNPISRLI